MYNATPEQWSAILDLAQKWGFRDIEHLCIRELENLNLSSVDRIHIYQRHGLDDALLLGSYEDLTTRDELIDDEEGVKLGLRTSLRIARAREISRGPDTGGGLLSPSAVQLNGPDLRTLISKIFDLRIQTNGAAHTGPFTAPINPSDRVDRASALPAVSDAHFFFTSKFSCSYLSLFQDGSHNAVEPRCTISKQLYLRESPSNKRCRQFESVGTDSGSNNKG